MTITVPNKANKFHCSENCIALVVIISSEN